MNLFSLRRQTPSLDDLCFEAGPSAMTDHLNAQRLMPSVDRPQQVFVRGQGSWLWDSNDRAYLDFSQAGGAKADIKPDSAAQPKTQDKASCRCTT